MNPVARLARLLRGLFRRRREDDETAEELRFHLELEAEKNMRAGMPPGEARRRARLRLGGADGIREAVRDARGGRPLEDLVRDLGYALRCARRNPGFTAAAVVSLAVPMGFNAAIFTIVDSVLFHPLSIVRPAQIVDLHTSHLGAGRTGPNSYPDYLDFRAANDVFSAMAAHAPMRAVVRVGEDVDLVMGETVTGNYFQFLGVRPVLGRLLAPGDDRPAAARVAVISSGLWERAFGRDPAVVGRDLHIGSQAYVVIGVAPPDFYGMPPIPGGEVWIPMTWVDDVTPVGGSTHMPSPGETRLERRGQRWMFIKGRLRNDVGLPRPDAAALVGDILSVFRRMEPDLFFFFQGDTLREIAGVTMLPLRIAAYVSGAAGITAMLLGAVGLYGVIAYVVAGRTRELAIRSALGARSGALLRLVLAGGAWVIAAGAGLGAVLAVLVAGVVSQLMPGITLADPVVWGIALLLITGVAAAAHAGPARRIMRLDLTQALHVE